MAGPDQPEAPEGHKRCPRCSTVKSLDDFGVRQNRGGQPEAYCLTCTEEYKRERAYQVKYGITPGQYRALEVAQGGVCAICGKPPKAPRGRKGQRRGPVRLAVDHDHKSGKVRGLLCSSCNYRLLGVTDRLDIFRAAVAYLQDPPAHWVLAGAREEAAG